MKIECKKSSGLIKCRCKSGYSNEKIPKDELYLDIQAFDAGGSVRIAICKKHINKVKEMFNNAIEEIESKGKL